MQPGIIEQIIKSYLPFPNINTAPWIVVDAKGSDTATLRRACEREELVRGPDLPGSRGRPRSTYKPIQMPNYQGVPWQVLRQLYPRLTDQERQYLEVRTVPALARTVWGKGAVIPNPDMEYILIESGFGLPCEVLLAAFTPRHYLREIALCQTPSTQPHPIPSPPSLLGEDPPPQPEDKLLWH